MSFGPLRPRVSARGDIRISHGAEECQGNVQYPYYHPDPTGNLNWNWGAGCSVSAQCLCVSVRVSNNISHRGTGTRSVVGEEIIVLPIQASWRFVFGNEDCECRLGLCVPASLREEILEFLSVLRV